MNKYFIDGNIYFAMPTDRKPIKNEQIIVGSFDSTHDHCELRTMQTDTDWQNYAYATIFGHTTDNEIVPGDIVYRNDKLLGESFFVCGDVCTTAYIENKTPFGAEGVMRKDCKQFKYID